MLVEHGLKKYTNTQFHMHVIFACLILDNTKDWVFPVKSALHEH